MLDSKKEKNTWLTFKDWEIKEINEGRINKEKTKVLQIPNHLHFENDELIIKGYRKLKILYANSCNLHKVDIECPSLKVLWLNDNKLRKINLRGCLNIRSLTISNNYLEQLDVWFLENLQTLQCCNNRLLELNCSHLKKLKDLDCSFNTHSELILEEDDIYKHKCIFRMEQLNVQGCDKLERIDADLNSIDILDFSLLHNLKEISVRENNFKISHLINKSNRESITFYEEMNINNVLSLDSSVLERVDYCGSDVKYFHNKSKSNAQLVDNNTDEGQWSSSADAPTIWEQNNYERQQKILQELYESGKHIYPDQRYLDLSYCNFFNSITIDGNLNYPQSLESVNLGGNSLKEVIVRNLPNLKQLIISHNQVKHLMIENCPQLDPNLFYHYKSQADDYNPYSLLMVMMISMSTFFSARKKK